MFDLVESPAPQPGKKLDSSSAKQEPKPPANKGKQVAKRKAPVKRTAKNKRQEPSSSEEKEKEEAELWDTESKGLFVSQDSDGDEEKPGPSDAAPDSSKDEVENDLFSTSKGSKREGSSPLTSRPAKRRQPRRVCRQASTRGPFLSSSEDSS